MIYQSHIIHVVLIEEQKVIREGLKILLESESDIKIVGSFSSSQEALAQIEELKPNIVLVSFALSEVDGLKILQEIQQKSPQVKIVVFCNEVNAANLVQYLELGVKACLLKDIAAGKIKELVRYVDRGYNHIEEKIFQQVLPELSDAVSALQTADSKFQDLLNSPSPETLFNHNYQLSSLGYGQNFHPYNNTQFYLPLVNGITPDLETSFASSEESTNKNWRQKIISKLALACLGLGAIITGIISHLQVAEIVIKDAVINGKTVAITSPVTGKIQEIKYMEGTNLEANQIFATLKPIEDKNLTEIISQLEMDISLKQEQIKNAERYLASLKNTLKILPRKSEIPINLPQSPQVATILLDNAREIANLEQQILNQQLNINLLSKELNNLENKLKEVKADSPSNQIIPLKTPVAGVISQINYREGNSIPVGQEIATFTDCQDLWVEAIVDAQVAAKINLQKNVSVQLLDREYIMLGKIKLLETLGQENTITNSEALNLTSTIIDNGFTAQASSSRLIIDVDFSSSELLQKDYCDLGLTATVSINN